jgi:hypothetical protein
MENVTQTSSSECVSVECIEVGDDNDGDGEKEDVTEFVGLNDAIDSPVHDSRLPDNTGTEPHNEESKDAPMVIVTNQQPFRRWMTILRKRHVHRRKDSVPEAPRWSVDLTEGEAAILAPITLLPDSLRRRSGSFSSSLACVTAMKSSSITVASTSIAPRSGTGGCQGKARIGHRSSGFSDARRSTDSHTGVLGPIVDESAWLRSLQRRKIVEELISSEESYIADLKVLINVRLFLKR